MSTTSNLSNALRVRYEASYLEAAKYNRLYDQFAFPASADREKLQRQTSVTLNFLSDMDIGTQTISETVDVNIQTLRDATVTISPTSRGEVLSDSEKLLLESYTDYAAMRFGVIGKNQGETVDKLAEAAMLQGSLVARAAARASLDAGTTGQYLTNDAIGEVGTRLAMMKVPSFVDGNTLMGVTMPRYLAVMGPAPYADLRGAGDVVNVAVYQDKRIILNRELGEIDDFRLIVSPWAKTFYGAGADNAAAVGTTLNGAVSALAKTVIVTANTNIAVGQRIAIGTEETANTHYAGNEIVEVTSISGTTMGVAGEGANGGLRFDHATLEAVRNADSVYTVAYGGPMSVAKVFASDVGEFGQVVGPYKTGNLEQFINLGWKWYGNYGRISESWLIRGEYTSAIDA